MTRPRSTQTRGGSLSQRRLLSCWRWRRSVWSQQALPAAGEQRRGCRSWRPLLRPSCSTFPADTGFRWLDRPIPDVDKAKATFRHIAADGQRAAAVIDSIRANFRNDNRTKISLDVNDLIQETVALARDDLRKHRILVKVESNPQKPRVIGDRIQLQQVMLNLITNAIDSMEAKEGPRALYVKSEVCHDGDVEISVEDTGTGISPQHIDRVFNPLFTTKSRGMGMGLSICRSIVEAHEGRLWVVRNTPEGAVFRFSLRADTATSSDFLANC